MDKFTRFLSTFSYVRMAVVRALSIRMELGGKNRGRDFGVGWASPSCHDFLAQNEEHPPCLTITRFSPSRQCSGHPYRSPPPSRQHSGTPSPLALTAPHPRPPHPPVPFPRLCPASSSWRGSQRRRSTTRRSSGGRRSSIGTSATSAYRTPTSCSWRQSCLPSLD